MEFCTGMLGTIFAVIIFLLGVVFGEADIGTNCNLNGSFVGAKNNVYICHKKETK